MYEFSEGSRASILARNAPASSTGDSEPDLSSEPASAMVR